MFHLPSILIGSGLQGKSLNRKYDATYFLIPYGRGRVWPRNDVCLKFKVPSFINDAPREGPVGLTQQGENLLVALCTVLSPVSAVFFFLRL